MAEKFGRNYLLNVQKNTDRKATLQIGLPFTCEFDITRNLLSSANVASIRVYNLSKQSQAEILKDQTNTEESGQKIVVLQAGYGDGPSFPIIFSGHVRTGYTIRSGVNIVSEFQAFDGGNAYINASLEQTFSGQSYQEIVTALIKSLSAFGVTPGTIGVIPGKPGRAYSVSGPTIDSIKSIVGETAFFIDNGKANVLSVSETLPITPIVISYETGLLNTPVREETKLVFEMLFEPRIAIGQSVVLDSLTGRTYNGTYKVASVQHRGTISGAVAGEATTTVTVFYVQPKL